MHIEGLPTKTINLLEKYKEAYEICRDNNKLNLQEEINKVFKDTAESGEIYFFHGSKNPNLTLLEPREVGKRSKTDGPLVFATNFIGLAASFIMSTRDDACIKSGFSFHNPQQKPIVIFKNKSVIVNNDCGGVIYVCNHNLDWQISLDKGFGINECTCNEKVNIIGRIPVKFAIEEMYKGGIEIFIADDESFKYLREQINKKQYRDYELAIRGKNFGVDEKFTLQKVNDSELEQLKNDIITRRENREKILGLQESFEKELEQIDKKYYGGRRVETDYARLSLEALDSMVYNGVENTMHLPQFYWLGQRKGILKNLITNETELDVASKKLSIISELNEYSQQIKNYIEEKKEKFEGHIKKNGHFYHGSIEKEIETFELRTQSSGDKIPLVYAAYSRAYSLSFILDNKGLNHYCNQKFEGPNAYYKGHNLTNLLNRDIGGTMYEFYKKEAENFIYDMAKDTSEVVLKTEVKPTEKQEIFYKEEAENFSYDMAKDTSEVVSKTEVKPTEKQEIISTLNELVLNNEGFKVFYGENEISPQELTLKDLYIARQQYIEKLAKNLLGNTKLIARLKKQQENLLSLAEQNGRKEEMDKIIKDYKMKSFSRNSACVLL